MNRGSGDHGKKARRRRAREGDGGEEGGERERGDVEGRDGQLFEGEQREVTGYGACPRGLLQRHISRRALLLVRGHPVLLRGRELNPLRHSLRRTHTHHGTRTLENQRREELAGRLRP